MRLTELSEDDARAIAGWHYPAPYDCYDSPAWEQMEREGWAICDDETRRTEFRALRPDADDGDGLSGYVRFRPDGDSVALHLGLRPDLCGQGLGRACLEVALAEARHRAGGLPVTLQVRRFNARAIAAYRRAGFEFAERGAIADVAGDPQQRLTMVLTDCTRRQARGTTGARPGRRCPRGRGPCVSTLLAHCDLAPAGTLTGTRPRPSADVRRVRLGDSQREDAEVARQASATRSR